jgi:hypothetical protein
VFYPELQCEYLWSHVVIVLRSVLSYCTQLHAIERAQ